LRFASGGEADEDGYFSGSNLASICPTGRISFWTGARSRD